MNPKDDKRPDVNHESPLLDFPNGDGDPNCTTCRGRGVTSVMVEVGGVKWPGGTQICGCVYKRDLRANVKRVWPVLLTVESVDESPLLALTKQSLWITASNYDIRRHLRHVAFRMGPTWNARVVADSTLATAWLSTKRNEDLVDPDVHRDRQEQPSQNYLTIVDLAVPFQLLILILGVKAAKNREMPNVVAEAIYERELAGKPTWVVDSLIKPLGPGHICYSEEVVDTLSGFRRVVLTQETRPAVWTPDLSSPAPADQGPPRSAYTKRKPGMLSPPAVPTEKPETSPAAPQQESSQEDYADDDCSPEALMAQAIDPAPSSAPPEDVELNLPDLASLSAEDLGAEHLPKFLRKPKQDPDDEGDEGDEGDDT